MPLLTHARFRPIRKKKSIQPRKFITFRLRHEWFALPVETVERITILGEIYGGSPEAGLSLTLYKGKQLLVVDVGQHLFGEAPHLESGAESLDTEQFLMILFNPQSQQFVGLPIDSPPVLKKLSPDATEPLPECYQSVGKIRCVSSSTVQADNEPLLFLVDLEQLFAVLSV